MSINLLPDEIINQIAAGEVIENPSAVVKELVENSIDSGATQIDIDIEDSGLKRITISDNGCGISKEDLEKAPLRHATSKIKNFNDLYNISTMGFRGEALASIFSVSKAKIVSKQNEGFAYEISSSDKIVKESGGKEGTSVHVEDIFYNTPARRKYLKSDNLEFKAILDIVNRFEVFYYNLKITLKHNGKIIVNKPAFKTAEENLYYVLGKDLRENLLEVKGEINGLKISGFLGKPSNITYSFKKNQYVYVNSRYIKSKIISDAIYEGFGTNLMEGRHPFFTVFIDVDPEVVDVNVHPTKIEIKFENELEIYEFIKNHVREVFEKNETFKPFEKKEFDTKLDESIGEIVTKNEFGNKVKSKSYYTKDIQRSFDEVKEDEVVYGDSNIDTELKFEKDVIKTEDVAYGPLFEVLKDYRIVGQVNKTFIILETPREMIIVDQHVAEEKFFYETFKTRVENSNVQSQKLLKPEIVQVTNQEMILFKENVALLTKVGFECEEFGANEIIVRCVPINLNKDVSDAQTVKDILYEITIDNKFKTLEEDKLEKLASMSCKRSIKAGHEMTTPEIHKMIENLKRLKEPFNCPHGRPILLNWKFSDLEKKFKRIV